jgi:anti-sigma factor ChrR (cupin superfamily)
VSEHHNQEGQEQALLYAVGALEPGEVAAFERHLQEGCTACQNELRDFQAVAAGLAHGVPQHAPSDNVRTRLMSRINKETGLTTLRFEEGSWRKTRFEGIEVRRLFIDRGRGTVSMLVRMAAGARYPGHRHAAVEECYVIEGDLHISGTVLLAGDYQRADLDSVHGDQWTEKGCTAFIISSLHNEVY